MAKIKKRKLRWKASESQQVVGYRLYWAEDGAVGYNSPFSALGNVTEVVLPDGVDGFSPKGGPVEFGVAAIDELGNESDLVVFQAPYQFNVPLAPEELWLDSLDEFHAEEEDAESSEPIALFVKSPKQRAAEAEAEAEEAEAEEGGASVDDDGKAYRTIQHYGHRDNERPS
jgi:hypothetical protein